QPRGRFRPADRPSPARRGGNLRMNDTPPPALAHRYWPLGQLVLARVREFLREPEAVFWVYGFPIVMTVVLGIAFRNKPIERIHVDVAEGPGAAHVVEVLKKDNDKRFEPEVHDLDSCRQRLRIGKVELVVVTRSPPSAPGTVSTTQKSYEYLFVPSRAES